MRSIAQDFDLSFRRICLLAFISALAGCAAEAPPRASHTPPPGPAAPPSARLGGVEGGAADLELSGVRGLTFEEFQTCMKQKAGLKQLTRRLTDLQPAIDREHKLIASEEAALTVARASINPTDGSAVDGFNARLGKQHERVRAFNRQVNDFNREVDKHRAERGSFSLNCAKRPFRTTDVELLPPELRAVASEDVEDFDLPAYFSDTPPPPKQPKAADLDLDF